MSGSIAIERHADASRFLEAAQDWLLATEAENNLLLGMALNWRGREPTDARPYWITLRNAGAIVGCACRTPPQHVVLSRAPAPALERLAADLSERDPLLNGVNGPSAEAEAFAVAWVGRRGGRWRTRFRMRLHELTQLALPPGAQSGALRKATAADLPLAREWADAYVRDTGILPNDNFAQRLIERGHLFLWIDGGEPRAMVAATRETRSGCSINGVYTPARFRRNGYATAAVAALSGKLLASGLRFCCLYTDAANPTSNSIYAKIGYKPIRDDLEIAFEPQ